MHSSIHSFILLIHKLRSGAEIKLQRAQNACVRFVSGTRKYDHISPVFLELGWMNLEQRRTLSIAVLMWNVFRFGQPSYLREMFVQVFEVHTRSTRLNPNRLVVPIHRICKFSKSFHVTACHLWNELEIYSLIDSAPSTIKTKLKKAVIKSSQNILVIPHLHLSTTIIILVFLNYLFIFFCSVQYTEVTDI